MSVSSVQVVAVWTLLQSGGGGQQTPGQDRHHEGGRAHEAGGEMTTQHSESVFDKDMCYCVTFLSGALVRSQA